MRQLGIAFHAYAIANRGVLIRDGRPDDWPPAILPNNRWYPTTLCPTGPREEWVSYLYNGYLIDINHDLDRARSADTLVTDMIVLGEKRLMYPAHYRWPAQQSYASQVDAKRHTKRLRSNYLFLDFHVDNQLPADPVDPIDPWAITRPRRVEP